MAGNIPQNLKYTKEHEWARIEGNRVVVGVTSHAQEALGDVVLRGAAQGGRHRHRRQAVRRHRVHQGRVGALLARSPARW